MQVPILDLKAQYGSMADEIDAAIKGVCEAAAFKLGPEVEQFERDWAAYCHADHCVGVSSGTAALHVALLALGVGPGDEVITTPMSFFATAEAILYVGARPVFVDVDPATFCIDPDRVEEAVTERTRAILAVHLFGLPADMGRISTIARRHDLVVIEDACQAHGSDYDGRRTGSLGHAAAFSFYPTKNLSACGEAGAFTTNDPALAARARLLREHGQSGYYVHDFVGYNYRMDGLQGAVLNVKLKRLDAWNARRREVADRYTEALADLPLTLPAEPGKARHNWYIYNTRCDRRDELREHLASAGVSTAIYYPVMLPELDALRALDLPRHPLPEAERMAREVLALPVYPEIADAQVDHVIESVRAFYNA